MKGETLLYLHGFASSGSSGTVRALRTLLPGARIVAPDLPVSPRECLPFLREVCEKESPDLILGSSMGGMYAELLRGYDRLLVNPAFQLADTLLRNNGLGRQEFHNPRQDGETSFLVTKGLLEEFRECSSHCFEGLERIDGMFPPEGAYSREQDRVWGLFGTRDTLVDTWGDFTRYYPHAVHFDGEHYLNDKVLLHSILPIIERIYDIRNSIEKKTILLGFEDTVCDIRHALEHGRAFPDCEPEPILPKAVEALSRKYELYFLCPCPTNRPELLSLMERWIEEKVGVRSWGRILFSSRKDMVIGDYLVERYPERYSLENFMGTVIELGGEKFHSWDEVIDYFSLLDGQ